MHTALCHKNLQTHATKQTSKGENLQQTHLGLQRSKKEKAENRGLREPFVLYTLKKNSNIDSLKAKGENKSTE